MSNVDRILEEARGALPESHVAILAREVEKLRAAMSYPRFWGPDADGKYWVEAWIGWHLGKDGMPAPMICDHNPGHLAHVTRYQFQVPPDVVEHLTGTRECLMLDKFGNMGKDCREG